MVRVLHIHTYGTCVAGGYIHMVRVLQIHIYGTCAGGFGTPNAACWTQEANLSLSDEESRPNFRDRDRDCDHDLTVTVTMT
jgi:hypothetical protein